MREMLSTPLQMQEVHHNDEVDESGLKTFLSLCETENMRDTAALERVNQSNVSRALSRLEADLGVALFHRHGRRLELNRYGALFREHASRAVADLESGRRQVLEEAGPGTGVIHLGFLQSLARQLVPDVLRRYRAVVPGSRFELRQGFARDLYGWLSHGALDAVLVTPPRVLDGPFGWSVLREQQLCLAVPVGHRLAAQSRASLSDAAGEPFVAFGPGTDLRRVVERLCAAAGVEPAVAFESEEIDTIRGLIGAGLGIGVLPRPVVLEHDDPVYLPLQPASTRTIGLAWAAGRAASPAVRRFVETAREW